MSENEQGVAMMGEAKAAAWESGEWNYTTNTCMRVCVCLLTYLVSKCKCSLNYYHRNIRAHLIAMQLCMCPNNVRIGKRVCQTETEKLLIQNSGQIQQLCIQYILMLHRCVYVNSVHSHGEQYTYRGTDKYRDKSRIHAHAHTHTHTHTRAHLNIILI